MPILAIPNEIEVELTHECNWNCPYCAINVHKLPMITYAEAKKKIMSIKNNSYVTLSGGEPGLLRKTDIIEFINILKDKQCNLFLNTNGLFLKKYPDLIIHFSEIIYHCSENLDINTKILNVNGNNINYMIIVTDKNINNLRAFLDKFNTIKFSIVAATYDNEQNGPILSKQNRYYILSNFSHRMTKQSIKRMIHEKDFSSMIFI